MTTWRDLISEYGSLRRLDGHTPQTRGQRFNGLIAELFQCWSMDARPSIRTTGEVDVAFSHAGTRYILEAKWEKQKADTGDIAKLQKRVRQRLSGTYGVFLAMEGYTENALADVADGERLEVLLLDRSHWEAMLSGFVPPGELFTLVHDRASFHGDPYASLASLLESPSANPPINFDNPKYMTSGPLLESTSGVCADIILSGIESHQLGIACRGNSLLVTTENYIAEVDPHNQRSKVIVPVTDCHRNAMPVGDEEILFSRRHGVGRYHRGRIDAIGGGFPGNNCLLRHYDGAVWAYDNGELFQDIAPSISMLGVNVGDEVRHTVAYTPADSINATWISASEYLTIGNQGFSVISVENGDVRRHRSPQTNPMGLLYVGNRAVLTVGDELSVGITYTDDWSYREIAKLALSGSVSEAAVSEDGSIFVAAYERSTGDRMRWAVVRLAIPGSIIGASL